MIAAGRAFLTLAIIPQAAAGPFWAAGPRGLFTEPPPGEDDRLCAQYANAEPPASDQPTPVQREAHAHCDREALLYGIGQPRDPVRARASPCCGKPRRTGR